MANNPQKFVQRFQGQVRIVLDAVDQLLALGREYEAMGYQASITDEQLAGLGVSAADVQAAMAAMAQVDGSMTAGGVYAALYRVAG